MPHLVSIRQKATFDAQRGFPFSVPAIASTPGLKLEAPVTFFVGENGTGKSTLLEAIAAGTNAIAIGGADVARDETLSAARELASAYRFGWKRRTGRGFFLRAEDFFNFGKRMLQATREFDAMIADCARELEERPGDEGLQRALGSLKGQRAAIVVRYGENLDANSHGETFMKVFQARLAPGGFYLLDEPEAALSPLRQLGLLSLLKEFAARDCQFIIATHSPILMAFPDAQILKFDAAPIAAACYEELQHVQITRAFLRDPGAFLHRL
jgi:predicted ATPase